MLHTLTPEVWPKATPYATALAQLEALAAEVAAGAPEQLIFCEHAPVLTLGSSANLADTGIGHSIPTHTSNRGGQVTFHGPGQRVIYPVVRLNERWNGDVRVYMQALMGWLQAACTQLGVPTEKRQGAALGLWIGDAKVAAFGVKVRKIQGVQVAYHGAALNVANDLEIYQHFTPCGLAGSAATRLIDHAPGTNMAAVDEALLATLPVFLRG